LRYPRSPHLRHVTSNIRGYGGAQQKKCKAKSDDEWDLPHDMAPPCVFALSRAAAVEYLLRDASYRRRSGYPCDRAQVASGLPLEQPNPLHDGFLDG
jgi:hypothetical protein